MTTPERATLIFALFLSLTAVFSPSYLFFSAGLLIQKIISERTPIEIPKLKSIKTRKPGEITENIVPISELKEESSGIRIKGLKVLRKIKDKIG